MRIPQLITPVRKSESQNVLNRVILIDVVDVVLWFEYCFQRDFIILYVVYYVV